METVNGNKEDGFRDLLNKASKGESKNNLTDLIMQEIQIVESKKSVEKKYIKRSWFFILVAVILAIKLLYLFSFIEFSIKTMLNQDIPGYATALIYFAVLGLTGLILYQLNNLISYQYSQKV